MLLLSVSSDPPDLMGKCFLAVLSGMMAASLFGALYSLKDVCPLKDIFSVSSSVRNAREATAPIPVQRVSPCSFPGGPCVR